MDLTFAELARTNRRRCESVDGFSHALDSWSLSDWMTATVGELGEAANVVKKLNRVRDGVPGNKETPNELRAMLADELADAVIYLDLLFQAAGIDLAAAVVSKFNRTSVKVGSSICLATKKPPVTANDPTPAGHADFLCRLAEASNLHPDDKSRIRQAAALLRSMPTWRPIETAPKDGTPVLLLSVADTVPDGSGGEIIRPARATIGQWNPDGDAWTTDIGTCDPEDGPVCTLTATGVWSSGGGWLEPGEVSHWMPLPSPPEKPR